MRRRLPVPALLWPHAEVFESRHPRRPVTRRKVGHVGTIQAVGIFIAAGTLAGSAGWWSYASPLLWRWVEVARQRTPGGYGPSISRVPARTVRISARRGAWAGFSGTVGAIISAALLFGRREPFWMVPFFAVWASGLAVLALVDRETLFLPSKLLRLNMVVAGAALVVQAIATRDWSHLGRSGICAVVAFAGFGAWAFLRPGGLGLGDARFAVLVALGAGAIWPSGCLVALTCAPLAAAVVATFRRRANRTDQRTPVALGPFLALAGIVAVVTRAV